MPVGGVNRQPAFYYGDNMPKLKCVSRYRGRFRGTEYVYNVGDEFNADADLAVYLVTDSPSSFVAEEPPARVAKVIDEPKDGELEPRSRSRRKSK